MKCPNCGEDNEDTTIICRKCLVPLTPTQASGCFSASGSLKNYLRSPTGIILAVVIVALAIFAFGFLVPWGHNIKQEKNQQMQQATKEGQQYIDQQNAMPGTYAVDGYTYIVLNQDGTFTDHNNGAASSGTWSASGNNVLLTYKDAGGQVTSQKQYTKDNMGLRPVGAPSNTVYLKR